MLSVRQVNELIRGALARYVPATLHVLGEIGDLSRPASGHLYFSLKDPDSELRCVMWRSSAARLKFEPEVGLEVIASGGIELYTPRGTVQLIVRRLEPRGVGALEIAFRQLKERLEREGLFAASRKRPLPRIPERIAVVTSPSGAAIRDILQTVRRRYPALEILLFPVRVQGEGAAEEIAAAVGALNKHAEALGGIDVAIVGRGGGSLEDLWPFNEEVVARAIAASRIPIVSAVGHEVDVTISDLVADLRAPTPTAAAELVSPSLADLLDWLGTQTTRAARSVTHAVQLARAELEATLAAAALARPLARINERRQLVDELQQRLHDSLTAAFRRGSERLAAAGLTLLRFRTGARFSEARRVVEQRLHRFLQALNAMALSGEHRLATSLAGLERAQPAGQLKRYDEYLRHTPERLAAAVRLAVVPRRRLLDARLQALSACDPRRVLQRGYSITRDARSRQVIRSVQQIRDKLRIITELADGEFHATADDPKQPGLFD
ncbi:MAG: exodeoxyribonuclease VII large subunit [Phycisphaerae bacterium]|nr:exodeoxyribonuclease VII large subunit [Phycisphaerae bacterium]